MPSSPSSVRVKNTLLVHARSMPFSISGPYPVATLRLTGSSHVLRRCSCTSSSGALMVGTPRPNTNEISRSVYWPAFGSAAHAS